MKTRLILALLLVAAITLGGIQAVASYLPATPNQPDKVDAALRQALTQGQTSELFVEFAEQANLSAAYSMDWAARGDYVVQTLQTVAQRTQSEAIAYLDKLGLEHRTFLAGNELYVKEGTLQVAEHLASLPGVARVSAPFTISLDPIIEEAPIVQATTAWGITDTKAHLFWSTFGVKGDGIVVANIDSGVQWDHPALIGNYKCQSNPSSPACWYDPNQVCSGDTPCDNGGHGTHTMGIMVADDDPSLPYFVGMAPNAKWIACNADKEGDSLNFEALSVCADWILAPDGLTANRPHVVNNSWGKAWGNDTWYLSKVNAWRAAGIFPAFGTGNIEANKPRCHQLYSPSDYQESFASVAHDESYNIANFSPGGPSPFGHDPYTKPNISAPGVGIWTTAPGSSYRSTSGTSVASPHTAGAVALLWSCNPSLVGSIDQTFQALQYTADPPPPGDCGAPLDGEGNYTYGYGYLNVLEAGSDYCVRTQWLPYLRGNANGWNSTIVVRNNSTSTALVYVTFFNTDGSVYSLKTKEILPNASTILTPPDGLVGSAKIVSSEDVSVVVENVHTSSTKSHAYAGVAATDPLNPGWGQAGTTLYAPVIMNNYYSWYSSLVMMNTGPTTASGNIACYRSSDGQNVYNQSFTIPSNGSFSFNYNTGAANTLYSARVTSSQPLAAHVIQKRKQNDVFVVFMDYNSFSAGSTTVHAPLIMNNYHGWDTTVTVQNTSASSASITVYYYNSNGSVVKTHTASIPAYSSRAYYSPNQGLPDIFIGTARVTSNKPVAVVVNQSAPHGGTPKRGLSYNGTAGGSTLAVIPDLMNYWGTQNWVSSVNVKNLGSTSTVATLTYRSQSYHSLPIQPNGFHIFYVPNYAGPTNGRGWATVSASQPVAVVVNHTGHNQPDVDLAFSYTASNR